MKILTKILACSGFMTLAAQTQAQTGTDYMTALKKADKTITFDVNAAGQEFRVNWGMDAAWDNSGNIQKGVNHIGKEHLAIGRVAYQPTELVKDNGDGTYELTSTQKSVLKSRCDHIKNITGVTRINITADQEAYLNESHTEYRTNYLGNWYEWYKCLKATVKFCQQLGMEVYSVSPFNEPDYGDGYTWGWLEGYKSDFLQMCKWIREDPFFDNIHISGGNTLNCDQADPWYTYLKDYLDEGNTHQLAGSFDNYAAFFAKVKADGKVATADELHNVGEAIVGANYGMENGIWWGFDSKARGQFCIDSNEGVRIGYGENRSAWTNGAVYRNEKTGEVHGYLGSSERQANTSSFAFVSTAKDVFFNGYGPTRMYVYDVPGGTAYQTGQINAERLFDITWGEDVAPGEVNGTYQIMNMASKKMLTWKGTENVLCNNRVTTGYTQQWKVAPGYTDGDISYWFIDANITTNTNTHLNVLNNSLDSGAGVICYNAGHNATEQWYLKYAQDGYYYIISRLSNKYLYVSSTSTNVAVTLRNAPDEKTTATELKKYLWRFQPTDAKAETTAPDTPADLTAKQRAGSIELNWTAPASSLTKDGAASYIVLRGEAKEDGSSTEWSTVGRNFDKTTFVDNTALAGKSYIYKVKAVDYAGNRSVASDSVYAKRLDSKALLCQINFEDTLADNTANKMDMSLYGKQTFSKYQKKSGSYGFSFDGSSYGMIPYSAADNDEMTIALWVYCNSSAKSWERAFDFGNSEDQYMFFCPNNGSEMRFVMKNGGDEQILTNGKKLGSSSWKHVAVTLKPLGNEKVQATLYVNGEQVAESCDFTIKPSDIKPSLCFIGRSMFSADPMFSGRLDDFRIYNYALSADEIANVMTDTEVLSKDINDSYEEAVATGIMAVSTPSPLHQGTFDMSGRKVNAPSHGIYIENGKKVRK